MKPSLTVLTVLLLATLAGDAARSATYRDDIKGDGVHDDTAGIQSLLDSGQAAVYLPPPPKEYLISRTLRIRSGQALRLDPFTVIRLAPGSDTVMITNDDHDAGNENIAIIGGIWDMDNRSQSPNPFPALGKAGLTTPYDPARFIGVLMRFNRVRNLTLQGLTLRDPTTFGAQLGNLYQFTVRDITFDYRHANPAEINMDGIHIHGNSRYGSIANLKGMTHDDLLALNADDGLVVEMSRGPIEDIAVDGLFAEDGWTAVRMLSAGSPIRRVSIRNIVGTYRYNVISFSDYGLHPGEPSLFEDITLRDIRCAKSRRGLEGNPPAGPIWHGCAPVYLWGKATVRNLTIDGYSRSEERQACDDIHIEPEVSVDGLTLRDFRVVNRTPGPIVLLRNRGTIRNLTLDGISQIAEGPPARGGLVENSGAIDAVHRSNTVQRNLAGEIDGIPPPPGKSD
jgi:hypothetical protein